MLIKDSKKDSEKGSTEKVSYRKLFKFFLPLAVMPMMISMTHLIINASLARLPYAVLSIAVFTVVKSISGIINSPTMMGRQMVLALVDDRRSFTLIMKVISVIAGIGFLTLLLFGVTPVGKWLLRDVIGIQAEKRIGLATTALSITSALPLVVIFRNVLQGLATGLERTKIIIPGVVLRLVAITGFLFWVIKTRLMSGIVAGSIAWVVGIALEGILILWFVISYYDTPGKAAEQMPEHDYNSLSYLKVIKFITPLIIMAMLTRLLRPIIQSGIARGYTPTQSLAAFGVSLSIVFLFGGCLKMLNQLSLIYTEKIKDHNWIRVKRFSLIVGAMISGLLIIVALTPVGDFILRKIIAVSDNIAQLSQQTILAFAAYPVIRAFRESYWGVLMKQRTTSLIAKAKTANIFVTGLLMFTSSVFLTINLPAAVVGALAYTIGESVETAVIWHRTTRKKTRIIQTNAA